MMTYAANPILALRPKTTTPVDTTALSRKELVEQHLWLVASEARRMARRLPGHVRAEDLIGAGCMGLTSAAQKFDPKRGTEFTLFARLKVRAAMLDELREMDVLPRRARAGLNRLDRARRALAGRLGRDPTREELARECNLTVEAVDELVTLNDRARSQESLDTLEQRVADVSQVAVDRQERMETASRLAQAISTLPPRLQQVLAAYYQGDMTFREIGARWGVTESRICQLHAEAVRELRRAL